MKRHIHVKTLSILALAVLMTAATASAGVLYAINDSDNSLYTVDRSNGNMTLVGSTGVQSGDFGDLTYNPIDGLLYWAPGRGNNNLYTIDRTTGAATLIGSHGLNDLFALAWDTTNNVLYGISASNNSLYTLNPTTAAATIVGPMAPYPGGMVYNPVLDSLLVVEAGPDNFYTVNRSTGAATLLHSAGGYVNDNGTTYDTETNSYWIGGWSNQVYQYDSSFNLVNSYSQAFPIDGMAFVADASAVPEPSTMLLLGGGLIAAGLLRRRTVR